MSKVTSLLNLLDEVEQPFAQMALKPLEKDIKKAGLRVTKTGRDVAIMNPKTKQKVIIKDDGKTLKARHMDGAQQVGKDDKIRGAAVELQKEIDSIKDHK